MDSILTSIKKLLGITEEYEHFDSDLIMHINTTFMFLSQIGIGPERGFFVIDKADLWTDFLPEDYPNFEAVKTYVYMRVKQMFDPPNNSVVADSTQRLITELEWRLNSEAERGGSIDV